MLKMTDVKLEQISDICQISLTSIYLLKKDQEEEFLTFLKDMLKQIINT